MGKFLLHFLFLVAGVALIARRGQRFYWQALVAFVLGIAVNAAYGVLQLGVAEGAGGNLDAVWLQPLTGGASKINVYGAIQGQDVYRINALTGDPNHLGIELAAVLVLLLPLYLRLERGHRLRTPMMLLLAFLLVVELGTLSRSGLLGLACGLAVLAIPYRRHLLTARLLVPLAIVLLGVLAFVARRANFFEQVLRSRISTEGQGASTHFVVYDFIPNVLSLHPLFGLGLNTFSVYYEFVTGRTNFGPHSFYVALFVESGLVGALVFAGFVVYLFRRAGATRRIGKALAAAGDPLAARVRPLGWGLTAALVATLASNAFYLTMSFYYFYALALLAIAAPTVFAGSLVRDGVEALRAEGLDVRVVSPASFRHFGIAYGDGIVNNLRRAPWKLALLPLFLLSFSLAARRAARDADVVHAHWLPSAIPAMATGKPFVLQLWGSDAALARRVRPLARVLVRRARVVVCASRALADDARGLGARDVRVIPSPVVIPASVGEPGDPPHALYVGRLSEEKGVRELAEAARGLPLVVVG